MSRPTGKGTIYRSGAQRWTSGSVCIATAMFAPYILIAMVIFAWIMWA